MAQIKINQAALRKMEKQVEDAYAKAAKRHPINADDTEADIRRKLTQTAKDAGITPDTAGIRQKAREIHKDLNK